MSTITYKCPNCAGRLEFNSTLQTMKCPFCDSTFAVAELEAADQALVEVGLEPSQPAEWVMPSNSWAPGEQEGMFVYTCQTCAGAIISDQTLSTTSCPYCGNPVIITERFTGQLKPDLVLPFQLTKENAKAALIKHYEGKPFLPKFFTDSNRIDEVKGVYVPFWLFDSIVDAEAVYDCTRVRRYSDIRFNYTETNRYAVSRSGVVEFLHVPVDGSEKLADDMMESIEPFDYSQLARFQTAYLAGYSANVYDVSAETAIVRAQERMKATTDEVVRSSISGYSTVTLRHMNIEHRNPHCFYALLPVWLLSSTYEGNVYTFAMNGQTGRLVGDLPIDKRLRRASYWKTASLVFGILMVLSLALGWMGG